MRASVWMCILAATLSSAALAGDLEVPDTRNPYIPTVAKRFEDGEYEGALKLLDRAAAWDGTRSFRSSSLRP